jgi:cytidylate kinase
MHRINIAIDGPAASGKSTTARLVARKLGYLYIDTGAMYRALTWAALRDHADIQDASVITKLARKSKIELRYNGNDILTFLDDENVSAEIRLPEVTDVISIIAAYGDVREIMVRKQQEMAREGGVVMDGRDIASVVLPGAEVKIFMIATVDERARRRYDELLRRGVPVDYDDIRTEIEKRDHLDSSRAVAPLKPTADAVMLDTTGMTIEQQVQFILDAAAEKTG